MRRSTVLACLLPFLLSLLAIGQPSAFKSTGPVASSTVHKIDPKLRTMAQAGGHLPVFIVLRSQPHKAILERVESPARLRLEVLEYPSPAPLLVHPHGQREGDPQLHSGAPPAAGRLAQLENPRSILKPARHRRRAETPKLGVELRREMGINQNWLHFVEPGERQRRSPFVGPTLVFPDREEPFRAVAGLHGDSLYPLSGRDSADFNGRLGEREPQRWLLLGRKSVQRTLESEVGDSLIIQALESIAGRRQAGRATRRNPPASPVFPGSSADAAAWEVSWRPARCWTGCRHRSGLRPADRSKSACGESERNALIRHRLPDRNWAD